MWHRLYTKSAAYRLCWGIHLEGRPPSTSETVAKFFVDRYGADKIFPSIGLWGKDSPVSSLELSQAILFAGRGGARKIWITPNHLLTPGDWQEVVGTLSASNTENLGLDKKIP